MVGTWGYETEAAVDDVASFYLVEMPKHGWVKIMHMPMGTENYLNVWQQGDGQLGATITTGKMENGMTYFSLIEARQRE